MRFDVCRKSRLARAATSETIAWRSKFPVACERNFELHLLKERLKTIRTGAETSIPRKKAGLSMSAIRAALVPDNSPKWQCRGGKKGRQSDSASEAYPQQC